MSASPTTATTADQEVRIVSVQSCSSVTGKSRLTYHVGVLDSEIRLRVHANSGGGFFSNEWVTLRAILAQTPAMTSFTSRALHRLFKGKSANTPAFLIAVLKQEGLVRPSSADRRRWERGDVEGFQTRIAELAEPQKNAKKKADTPVSVSAAAATATRAGPARNRSAKAKAREQ